MKIPAGRAIPKLCGGVEKKKGVMHQWMRLVVVIIAVHFGIDESIVTDQAEFESKVRIAAQEAAAEVEKGWAQATADITKSVQSTLAASPILQRAWASVMFLEVTVLVWYQIGAPAYRVITGVPWPEPGISLDLTDRAVFPATPDCVAPSALIEFKRVGAHWLAEVPKGEYAPTPLRELRLVFAEKAGCAPFSLTWKNP